MTTKAMTREQMEEAPHSFRFATNLGAAIATIERWEPHFRHTLNCSGTILLPEWGPETATPIPCPECEKARQALERFDGRE